MKEKNQGHIMISDIALTQKKCGFDGCDIRPFYGIKNSGIPLFCNTHRDQSHENVIFKKCESVDCKSLAKHSYDGMCKLHCIDKATKEHKDNKECKIYKGYDSFIPLMDPKFINKTCPHLECNLFPSYALPGSNGPLVCVRHKLPNYEQMIYKYCSNIGCKHFGKKLYDGLCSEHFYNKPFKNTNTPENAIRDFIKKLYSDKFDILFNEIIPDGISSRRPDVFIDMSFYAVLLEIDENQHKYGSLYTNTQNKKRIDDLLKDIAPKLLVLIRFNPNNYKKNKTITQSYWSYKQSIRPKYLNDWNSRLDTLKKTLDYWLDNMPNKQLTIIKLYYDSK